MQYIQYIYIIDLEDVRTQIPPLAFLYFKKKWAKIFWICLYDNFGSKFSSINAGNGQHHIRPISSLIQVRAISKKNSQPARGKVTNPRSFQRGTKNLLQGGPQFSGFIVSYRTPVVQHRAVETVRRVTAPLTSREKKQDPFITYTYIGIWSDMYVYIISSIHVCICNIPIFVQKAFAALCMSGALHNKKMVYIEFICI